MFSRSKKSEPKVLIITGIHGNEERTKLITDEFLKKYLQIDSNIDIEVFHLDSGFKQRDVQFNLNRIDQVNHLNEINSKMEVLKAKIQISDIVLDLHNSEICSNKLLVSVTGNLPEWYVYKKKYLNDIIWRRSEFISISEYARLRNKIAFTVEFGGMVSQTKFVPKEDLKFLKRALKLSLKIFEYEKQIKKEVRQKGELGEYKLFDEYNQLLTITLNNQISLYSESVINSELVKDVHPAVSKNDKRKFVIVSPESNYGKVFEGTILRPKFFEEEQK